MAVENEIPPYRKCCARKTILIGAGENELSRNSRIDYPSPSMYFCCMARGRHPTRIHIPPPDEQTAARYLIQWNGRSLRCNSQHFPGLTSQELFGNNKPLEIDFGCGMGILACNRAYQSPETNVLGIDQSQKPLFCAVRDAKSYVLENIKFIRGDFTIMIPLLRPNSIAAAFYLFPNPPQDYHKERANDKRRRFLEGLYSALIPGGRIYFATDAPSFFACMNGIVKNELHFTTSDFNMTDCDIITRYRKLWEEQRRNVNSFVIGKEV